MRLSHQWLDNLLSHVCNPPQFRQNRLPQLLPRSPIASLSSIRSRHRSSISGGTPVSPQNFNRRRTTLKKVKNQALTLFIFFSQPIRSWRETLFQGMGPSSELKRSISTGTLPKRSLLLFGQLAASGYLQADVVT